MGILLAMVCGFVCGYGREKAGRRISLRVDVDNHFIDCRGEPLPHYLANGADKEASADHVFWL
ncbi:hypothetical protein [Salinicola tamaricis]|uniref:hypothetical protein n=1 Tax=Salinicola tamaricis TaxID=1771309 RepID=UPI00101AD293|nr:hypothetical protein [Salinicola tamaricis]